MVDRSVEVIALPAAFTAITGRAHWETLVRARAIENLCCDRIGARWISRRQPGDLRSQHDRRSLGTKLALRGAATAAWWQIDPVPAHHASQLSLPRPPPSALPLNAESGACTGQGSLRCWQAPRLRVKPCWTPRPERGSPGASHGPPAEPPGRCRRYLFSVRGSNPGCWKTASSGGKPRYRAGRPAAGHHGEKTGFAYTDSLELLRLPIPPGRRERSLRLDRTYTPCAPAAARTRCMLRSIHWTRWANCRRRPDARPVRAADSRSSR